MNIPVVKIKFTVDQNNFIFFFSSSDLFFFAIFTLYSQSCFDSMVEFEWWKEFKDDFSIYKYSYYTSFRVYYNILKGTSGAYSNFDSDGQAAFFASMISGFSIYDPKEKDEGRFLLPFNMCRTIVPKEMSDKYDYPDNNADWITKFQDWGFPENIPANIDDLITAIDQDKYQKANDNFLWNEYNIPQNSPLLLSFYADTSTGANGEKWYPDALSVALGSDYSGLQAPFGGWWGYAKFGIAEQDYASLVSYIYATEARQSDAAGDGKSCGWGRQVVYYKEGNGGHGRRSFGTNRCNCWFLHWRFCRWF